MLCFEISWVTPFIPPSLKVGSPKRLRLPILGLGLGTPKMPSALSLISNANIVRSQWLIDVSRDLPSAQLDGFDISKEQYPCKAWLPSNISLSELDITKEIPPHLEGMYDLVHVQLFLCVVQQDGPAAILKLVYKLLSASLTVRCRSGTDITPRAWRIPAMGRIRPDFFRGRIPRSFTKAECK